MERITTYIFVKASPDALSDRVSELILKGMQPFGSPVMVPDTTMIGQALVGHGELASPPTNDAEFELSHGFRVELLEFAYALANGTICEDILPCSIDYSPILHQPGEFQHIIAIWSNVLQFDRKGAPTNVPAARRRAAQYIRSYIDPSYIIDPPLEDFETGHYA
jgi:hypothetical protein